MKGQRKSPQAGDAGSTHSYPCYMVNGYPLVEIGDGRLLLDTGFPQSCCDDNRFELCGLSITAARIKPPRGFFSLGPRDIGDLIGTRISGLVGMDILGRLDFVIDLAAGTATFSTSNLELSGAHLHVKDFMGIPIVEAKLDGRTVMCVLDTAAKLSYVNSAIAARYQVTGVGTDFFPTFGEFKTETRSIAIVLGERGRTLEFGVLPSVLERPFRWAGIAVVAGSALLEEGPVLFSQRRRKIVIGAPVETGQTGSDGPTH